MDLKKYWDNAVYYDEYKDIIKKESLTDGDLANYTKRNIVKIERIDKTLEFSDELLGKISKFKKGNFLVITEGWCGDGAQILPVIEKISEINSKIKVKIAFRDKSDLIESYLTNGGKSIPIIISLDPENFKERYHWGPRPRQCSDLLKKYKADPENYTHDNFIVDVKNFYNKDKGASIVNELLEKENA